MRENNVKKRKVISSIFMSFEIKEEIHRMLKHCSSVQEKETTELFLYSCNC